MFYERTLEKNTLRTSDHRTRHLCVMMNNVFFKKKRIPAPAHLFQSYLET